MIEKDKAGQKVLIAIGYLFGLVVFFGQCWATDKPTVTVEFHLAEQQYRDHFNKDITEIEEQISASLLASLSDHVGFLHFTLQQTGLRLKFTFDDRFPHDHGVIREVGFHIQLIGVGVTTHSYWKYSDAEAYPKAFGTRTSFLTTVDFYLRNLADYNRLVGDVLSDVPIAQSGAVVRDTEVDIAWIIPYKPQELCLDLDKSLFWVENTVKTKIGPEKENLHVEPTGSFLPEEEALFPMFRGDIVARPRPDKHPEDQLELDRLRRVPTQNIQVGRVFVRAYTRKNMANDGPLGPSELLTQEGPR